MSVLEVAGVWKHYGATVVLDDLDISIPEGSVCGLVGRNGAGKTTTMKIIAGLLQPDAGEVRVNGCPVRFGAPVVENRVGYLPDVPEFYGYMRPLEYMRFCGRIAGITRTSLDGQCGELLKLVGLDDVDKKIRGFSRGMKQRLGIAQALLSEPKLLLCDEPTSALDPPGREEILSVLQRIRHRTTVVFSTHILSDVEKICDRIAVLEEGRIVLDGELAALKRARPSDGYDIICENTHDVSQLLHALAGEDIQQDGNRLIIYAEGRLLLAKMQEAGMVPLSFSRREPTLDDLFREVIQ
ncbi:MAG: ATP-binding cassette domain-containing protein [Peptoniphilaceae bacterium]|jgi:ABC-2 type transport system ATP-binding protein